jgi:hypothetical protein
MATHFYRVSGNPAPTTIGEKSGQRENQIKRHASQAAGAEMVNGLRRLGLVVAWVHAERR